MANTISRRSFIKGSLAVTGTIAASSLSYSLFRGDFPLRTFRLFHSRLYPFRQKGI